MNRNVDADLTEESEGDKNDDEDHPNTNDNEGCDQAVSQYLEISIESNVKSDIPVETEEEIQGIDVKSDEVAQGDQTLGTKKRKCSGSDENLDHHVKSLKTKTSKN